MARPSDREFQLKRQLKELEEQVSRLEIENAKLKKQLDKLKEPETEFKKVAKKQTEKTCPTCGALIKSTSLPHGILDLCSSACGWRQMRNHK